MTVAFKCLKSLVIGCIVCMLLLSFWGRKVMEHLWHVRTIVRDCFTAISRKYNDLKLLQRRAKGEYGEGREESKRDRRRELGQQRQTGMDDVVSGDGGLFWECDREKTAAHSSGQTSQMRSTLCAICQPSVTHNNLRYQMIRLLHASCRAKTCSKEQIHLQQRKSQEKFKEAKIDNVQASFSFVRKKERRKSGGGGVKPDGGNEEEK